MKVGEGKEPLVEGFDLRLSVLELEFICALQFVRLLIWEHRCRCVLQRALCSFVREWSSSQSIKISFWSCYVRMGGLQRSVFWWEEEA